MCIKGDKDCLFFPKAWLQSDCKRRMLRHFDWEVKTAGCETVRKACWTDRWGVQKGKEKKKGQKIIVLGCECVCVTGGRVIGCGRERNTLSVCRGVGLCPPSLWLQPHLPCILKRQNAEPWTQLLALHQSSRLTLTCCTQKNINWKEVTHHHQVATCNWDSRALNTQLLSYVAHNARK